MGCTASEPITIDGTTGRFSADAEAVGHADDVGEADLVGEADDRRS